ncbi:MAG TPA: UPF0182 family protein [Actinophytocola sp.]|uniref:UPF0182 family protein n=1 Tax=Actinophytocola sp. TaxID=1872138 RepID=UPI002DDCB89F|nr:UPF0182 family protein [Actinophytocola sp.]HEV2781395.1 UPF0182 family protein [Actinophytocola sp.]
MATRPPIGLPKLSRRSRILLIIAATVILLLLVGARLLDTYVDWLWFGEVGYRSVFSTVLLTRIGLFFAVGILVGGLLALSLIIAYRTRPVFVPVSGADDPLAKYRSAVMQRVRLFGIGIPLIVGLIAGSTAQGDWQVFQLLVNGTPFGITDPEFGKDIGFYAFTLPFITWLISWLFVAIAIAFFGALITHYLFGGVRLVGRGGQFSVPARMQLSITAGTFVVVYAVDYFFERYELLFSDRNDLFNGATYTDLNAVLPAKLILMFIAGFCAVAFFVGAFLRNLQLPAIATALLVLTSILIGAAWPAVLEQFSVRPNANQKEAKSIERAIKATRDAFGLNDVKVEDYSGKSDASPGEVRNDPSNVATISNLRLLDPSILSPTFTQREGRENFYGFPEKLDIDRYTVDNKTQDYIVAAREIRTEGLAENQRNWINQHLVFTHGNGFVAAPANTVNAALQEQSGQGGYPVFSVSDISQRGKIRVDQPRVYYGELSTNYAIVGGQSGEAPGEYDSPTDRSFIYDGKGGVAVNGWLNRLVFAAHYGERNILFSSAIGDGSKIMYNRDPRERVIKAAPWLTVDGDPYPAVINGRIQWIVDGYTTLGNYPYAQRTALGEATTDTLSGVARQDNRLISYIRNSVKATVDAYDGTVTLYSIDDKDPVLKTWQSVFPGTVKAGNEVPDELRAHFRYPEDLFKVQRELLKRYHVSSPQEFFSTQTFWDTPPDPTKDGNSAGKLPPYYVYAQAPGQSRPTFQLTSAMTLLERQFLAAWVSVSSDPQDYGTIRVLKLPTTGSEQATDQLAEGPVQVQNRFQTTPKVTEQQTLFRNTSVTVTFGNLLTLPIAGGLLYVEPMYIQRNDANSFPQLARVLVAFGDRVGFEPTIDAALDAVFGKGTGEVATPPSQGGQPTTSPAPSSTTPPPASGGGTNAELDAAVQAITAAITKLKAAQQSGNFEEQGRALAELDAAAKRYDAAKAKLGTSTSSPPSSPSTTPTPGNGGG